MGKRSTNSTKGGKFMNPTDQARKEARKKELKKNKKQRQMVRSAVLKGKNPRDIVSELEKLDDMEFNVLVPPPLNDKVLRDKRRKLHETWTRVMRMYERDDVEQYVELKKLWISYQNRKNEVVQHFESVRNAQNCTVEEIPLPDLPMRGGGDLESISLPPAFHMQPKAAAGILKKPSVLESLKPKTCPGVPMGPPPKLEDYDVDEEESPAGEEGRKKTIRFDDEDNEEEAEDSELVAPGEESGPQVDEIQRKMLQMAGQDVDQYMREMEEVHRQTQADKSVELQTRLARFHKPEAGGVQQLPGVPVQVQLPAQVSMPTPLMGGPPSMHHNPAAMMMAPRGPQQIMYRPAPPPLRPGMAPPSVRLPPGPPPGRPPLRMPPGPPPGLPGASGMRRMPHGLPPRPQGVLSAAPKIHKDTSKPGGVIEAKPQMRNLKSDITRFVPTNVKLRTAVDAKKKQADPMQEVFKNPSQPAPQQTTKDDAYAQFMKEMDQFIK